MLHRSFHPAVSYQGSLPGWVSTRKQGWTGKEKSSSHLNLRRMEEQLPKTIIIYDRINMFYYIL